MSRKEGKTARKGERGRKGWEVVWWNVAGLARKDVEFWGRIGRWDIIIMLEMWVEEKGWGAIRGKLPRGFIWEMQAARRDNNKGRAKGGMVAGVRKELVEGGKGGILIGEEGLIEVRARIGAKVWNFVGVYVSGDLERKLERMEEWAEKGEKEGETLIGGDFNARTGTKGGGGH